MARKSTPRATAQTPSVNQDVVTNPVDQDVVTNPVDQETPAGTEAASVGTDQPEAETPAGTEAASVGTDQPETETPAPVAETVTKKKRRLINPQPTIDRKVAAVEKVGGHLVYQDRKWVLSADDKVISRMASTDFALILPSGFVDKISEARAAWALESQEG
jgi:hypothetical protein